MRIQYGVKFQLRSLSHDTSALLKAVLVVGHRWKSAAAIIIAVWAARGKPNIVQIILDHRAEYSTLHVYLDETRVRVCLSVSVTRLANMAKRITIVTKFCK